MEAILSEKEKLYHQMIKIDIAKDNELSIKTNSPSGDQTLVVMKKQDRMSEDEQLHISKIKAKEEQVTEDNQMIRSYRFDLSEGEYYIFLDDEENAQPEWLFFVKSHWYILLGVFVFALAILLGIRQEKRRR